MKKNLFVIITSILACIILYFVEQSIGVSYLLKTTLKILLFVSIPFIYYKFVKKESFKNALKLNKFKKKDLTLGLTLGIISFIIILITYFILKDYIDLNNIMDELQNKLKITPISFIFVGLYITLGNSFLEEFFFRGFIFLNLYELGYKKLGYIFSSFLFGLYHIVIFKSWFSLPITLLALFGLISVGFVFNFLDTKSKNLLNSWIVHALADSAIILIGLKMFFIGIN
ncbi:CPBP family intramembrane glutamic endopeptidase [Clostridium sp. DL1XJH146]